MHVIGGTAVFVDVTSTVFCLNIYYNSSSIWRSVICRDTSGTHSSGVTSS